jgi:hypothetical protein
MTVILYLGGAAILLVWGQVYLLFKLLDYVDDSK